MCIAEVWFRCPVWVFFCLEVAWGRVCLFVCRDLSSTPLSRDLLLSPEHKSCRPFFRVQSISSLI
jgi:hypothetical protein